MVAERYSIGAAMNLRDPVGLMNKMEAEAALHLYEAAAETQQEIFRRCRKNVRCLNRGNVDLQRVAQRAFDEKLKAAQGDLWQLIGFFVAGCVVALLLKLWWDVAWTFAGMKKTQKMTQLAKLKKKKFDGKKKRK